MPPKVRRDGCATFPLQFLKSLYPKTSFGADRKKLGVALAATKKKELFPGSPFARASLLSSLF
jgi:hypothetical protein